MAAITPNPEPTLKNFTRLILELSGIVLIVLYGAGLFLRDPDATFGTLTASVSPLFAAALALAGVQATVRETRKGAWWSRAQWVIEEIVHNTDDRAKLQPMVRILNDLYESDPPSNRHAELLSRVMEDIFDQLYDEMPDRS